MPESTISTYDQRAASYETKWESYLNHTHEKFLRQIETKENDLLLDVSGGTGLLAEMLIEQDFSFKHLTVNDPSEKMLEIARTRLSGISNVGFSNFKAEELHNIESRYDRIFCLNAFHFYPHQQQVLQNFHHLLTPAGVLYILDWNRSGFFRLVNKLMQWSSSEYIDTRSRSELNQLLLNNNFHIQRSTSWNWHYWKFLFTEAGKIK